jgi:hypothetical protein
MEKITLKLNRTELGIMAVMCELMISHYNLVGADRSTANEPWAVRLKMATLRLMKQRIDTKLSAIKTPSKVSFPISEICAFMDGLRHGDLNSTGPYILGLVSRLKQEIEPKFN